MTQDFAHARAFLALSHPRRIRLLRILAEEPETGRNTRQLFTRAAMPEASFRHHLQIMERAGLVIRRRKGPEVSVRLTPLALKAAMASAGRLIRDAQALEAKALPWAA